MKLKRFNMEIPLVEDITKEESKKDYIKVTYKDEDGEHTEVYDVDTWEDVKKTCEGRSSTEPFEVISEEYVDESETREFGLLDKAGRAIRRGTDRFLNRRLNRDKEDKYKAGVVYLNVKVSPTSITYTLGHKATAPFDTAKEANDDIINVINEIWDRNEDIDETSDSYSFHYPIVKMKAVVASNYETEIKNEVQDARESQNWEKLSFPKVKYLKS